MQTCPECGGRNEDGELFCGACGTYLEWAETAGTGQPGTAADDGQPVPAAETDAGSGTVTTAEPAVPDAPEPVPATATDDDASDTGAGVDVAAATEPGPDAGGTERAAHSGSSVAGRAAGIAGIGGLGGRAARLARQAADQATGGAVTTASSSASRARSQTRNVTQAPGRAVGEQAARAAGGGPLGEVTRSVTSGRGSRSAAPAAGTAAAGAPPDRLAGAHEEAAAPATLRDPAPAAAETAPVRSEPASRAPAPVAEPAPAAPGPTRPEPAQPAPTRPTARQPAARKPGAPAPRRPVPRTEEDEPPPRPGDLICGACGAGNAPHRNFCHRCGASLADAPVQPQRSWWQRVLRPDPRPGPVAGTRPRSRRRRRFPTGLVVTLVVLGLLAGGAWYFRDTLAGAYEAVVDRVAGNDPINPTSLTASSERADRPAAYVRDGIADRSWAPEGDGTGEWVELVLPEPARLVTVLVTAGNGAGEEQRLLEARPQRVRLTLTTADGEVVEDVDLTDTGEPQPVPVGESDVEAVRLTILSVFGEELQAPVAVAEVELRGRG